jgi:hypothetical protein
MPLQLDMQHALYITKKEDLDLISDRFSRLYFGSEFCEHLIPDENFLINVISIARDNNLDFSLNTPWCSDFGVKKIKKILEILPEGSEVVFNDFGVLCEILKYKLIPVMGRLLVSAKRDPRKNFQKKYSEYLQTSNLNNTEFQKYLIDNNIYRVDIDNVFQGYNFLLNKKIKTSLHYPYVYITTSRKCFFGNCSYGHKHDGEEGEKLCLENLVTAKLAGFDGEIYIKGNSQFYKNNDKPKVFPRLNIDRLIFSPQIPIGSV